MTIEPYQLSKGTILFLPLMIFVSLRNNNHIVCYRLLCCLECNTDSRAFFSIRCSSSEAHQAFNRRMELKRIKTTTAGFEPARAKPNRFLVCLLNHSDKLSCYICLFMIIWIHFVTNNPTDLKVILYDSNHILGNLISCCTNGRGDRETGLLIGRRKLIYIGKHKHGYHCLSNMEWSSCYYKWEGKPKSILFYVLF